MDLSLYAGRWLALTESRHIVGVGLTREEAIVIGRGRQPKEHIQLVWVSPQWPYVAFPDWPLSILRPLLLSERVWLAGGVVRDLLLARPMHDWDFVVNGDALTLARRIADILHAPFYPLDKQRGTGRVLLPQPGSNRPILLDFAQLRADSLIEDLQRRDFTINAMALSLDGQWVDPTNGLRDLQQRIIRLTQKHSFDDDPLRLLRAVRQVGTMGFNLEPSTQELLQRKAPLIQKVSPERVRMELRKILKLDPVKPALTRLQTSGILAYVMPEVNDLRNVFQSAPHGHTDAWSHTISALSAIEKILSLVQGTPRKDDPTLPGSRWAWQRLASLLHVWQPQILTYLQADMDGGMDRSELLKWSVLYHDVGKAETRPVDERGRTHFYDHEKVGAELARQRLSKLRFPKKGQEFVALLVQKHITLLPYRRQHPTRRAIYRFYRKCGNAGVGVILLTLAETLAVSEHSLEIPEWNTLLRSVNSLIQAYFEQHTQIVAPRPLLTGKDLLALGIPQGPKIGMWLEKLRERQAESLLTTREEARAWLMTQLDDSSHLDKQ